MRGLAVDIMPAYGPPAEYDAPVIGVAAAARFPASRIRETLAEGIRMTADGTVWVCRAARPGTGDETVNDVLSGQDTIVLETNPWWRKGAADWRDYELVWGCSKIVIFHLPGSARTEWLARARRFFPHITIVDA